jgi:hypothetical protein
MRTEWLGLSEEAWAIAVSCKSARSSASFRVGARSVRCWRAVWAASDNEYYVNFAINSKKEGPDRWEALPGPEGRKLVEFVER